MTLRGGEGRDHFWQVIETLQGEVTLPICGLPPYTGCKLTHHLSEIARGILHLCECLERRLQQKLRAVSGRWFWEEARGRVLLVCGAWFQTGGEKSMGKGLW